MKVITTEPKALGTIYYIVRAEEGEVLTLKEVKDKIIKEYKPDWFNGVTYCNGKVAIAKAYIDNY